MCGIAGMVGLEATEVVKSAMLKTMERRGPDANGTFQADDVCLLHARLAIIDPERGQQPMVYNHDGQQYVLVYNGELYNTEEIRRELLKLGHSFEGHSDTEVVLHAYAQWEEGCVDRFNGIFAFAVWESKTHRLFLARDRIGVKPLFYKLHDGGLLFASEMKTILTYPTVKAELDREGAAQLLLLGPGRMPGSGVFRGICEVEPGCCGYFRERKLKLRRYWSLKDREHTASLPETVEYVRYLVTDAIRRQMVSDVPIGTFLSGGLDSSIITAICAEEMKNRGEVLDTFSVDYANNERYFQPSKFQPNSDGHYIRLMCDRLQTDHHWSVFTPEALLDALEDATIARDLPGMADVDFSLLAFCREIRKDVKVALSGECADEIFGGYPWYRDPEIRSQEGFPWAQNTNQRIHFLSPALAEGFNGADYVMDAYRSTCAASDILPDCTGENRRMKEMVNLNFYWFMQTLLDRKDRMSMYSSLEVRVPFCDYRIAEYLYAVPWKYKDLQGKEKGLLRTAIEGLLPEEVLWRKKSPYPKTHDPVYLQMVSSRLRQLLDDASSPLLHIVNRNALEILFDRESVWPWYGQLMRTPQTMAYFLQLDFWLRHYQVDLLW